MIVSIILYLKIDNTDPVSGYIDSKVAAIVPS